MSKSMGKNYKDYLDYRRYTCILLNTTTLGTNRLFQMCVDSILVDMLQYLPCNLCIMVRMAMKSAEDMKLQIKQKASDQWSLIEIVHSHNNTKCT